MATNGTDAAADRRTPKTPQAGAAARSGFRQPGTCHIPFYCGPYFDRFAAFIPGLQSWLTAETSDEILTRAESRIRKFLEADAGLLDQEDSVSLGGSLNLVTTPPVGATRVAVQTIQAGAVLASMFEETIPGLQLLEERFSQLFGWERKTVAVPVPVYFLPGRLKRAEAYFEENFDRLRSKFDGQYVAIVDRRVVANGTDLDKVTKKAYSDNDERPILFRRVTQESAPTLPAIEWAADSGGRE